MKKDNIKRLALVAALVAVVGIGGSLAYFTDTDTKTNTVTIGNVNGTMNEEKDGETLTPDQEGFVYENILPGDALDKQPFVTLGTDSQDAYVRVRVEVVDTDGATKTLTPEMKQAVLDNLSGTEEGWVVGNTPTGSTGVAKYYYLQAPLTAGQISTKVFTTVNIPTAWDSNIQDVSFQIKVTADLVQAANVEEVLETDNLNQIIGWGEIGILPAN